MLRKRLKENNRNKKRRCSILRVAALLIMLSGENDNCVLSGHRNTVFPELGKVREGDSLIVTTSAGTFEYVVRKVRIVDKNDRTVIVPRPQATLTVSTCYPFVYTGSAPQRYILVAYLRSAAEH